MNRINPLHIGIFLSVLLVFVSFQLTNSKELLIDAKTTLEETKELSLEVTEFKDIYGDGKKITKSIDRILRLNTLKNLKIEVKKTKSGLSISSEEMNKKALNSLMGKLLNGSYNIENLKIKKITNEKASLYVEIKW